jgi:nitrite reductase (NADH) small subunit
MRKAKRGRDELKIALFNHHCGALPSAFSLLRCASMQPSRFGNFKKPRKQGQKITVGRAEDVPEGRGATVELLDGTELALYNVGGEFFAIENFCPHKGAPLADGLVCGPTVECDWHGWRFDLRTGQCLTNSTGVEAYEVIIEDGWIKIMV